MLRSSFYSALATSILAGEINAADVAARMTQTLSADQPPLRRFIRSLSTRLARNFGTEGQPRRKAVIQFLRSDEGLRDAERRFKGQLRIVRWINSSAEMRPDAAARNWPLPRIDTEGELAAWLNITASELDWFADLKSMNVRAPLHHYNYRALAKTSGSIRLIESPQKRLKELQKIILRESLVGIPTHAAAHGFVKGRSITTFAAPHVGQRVVLRIDLKDFFPSIQRGRVQALLRTAGYPERVAALLAGILCNAAPRGLWKTLGSELDAATLSEARALYGRPHLPQGAPTSPMLANLCAWRVDCRLSGLARASGATYTRYADDLAFSGGVEFERSVQRFAAQAAAILLEEGFEMQHRKTRVMRQGVRQHLTGLVTNAHLNVPRADFDRLKAILTNCVRHGAESQNREAHPSFRQHLDGRIGFVQMVNAARGARLKKIFEQIDWVSHTA